jgi:hypothetical protein
MPLDELAARAVSRLFDVVAGRAVVGDVVIATPPTLLERSSTAPPPAP